LISTYELGHQPFGLAEPIAWLRRAGHDVRALDLAVEQLDEQAVRDADLVAVYLPMHTATRLAARLIPRVRQTNPTAHLAAAYGLYAPLQASYLRGLGVNTILGGEFEEGLTMLAAGGRPPSTVSLARLAFLPLLIIWLGIGLWSKVVLIFLGGVFAVIINTEAGVAHIDPRLVETARAFTASNRQVLIKVVIPAAIPFILAGLRQAVGRVLIMVVVAELYAATAGLGYLIFQGGAMYDTTQVFAGVTLLAGSGIALNQALRLLEQRVAPWLQTRDI